MPAVSQPEPPDHLPVVGTCMGRVDELAETSTGLRSRLTGIAYPMLGTTGGAEDVVSGCWLRLVVADEREPVRESRPGARWRRPGGPRRPPVGPRAAGAGDAERGLQHALSRGGRGGGPLTGRGAAARRAGPRPRGRRGAAGRRRRGGALPHRGGVPHRGGGRRHRRAAGPAGPGRRPHQRRRRAGQRGAAAGARRGPGRPVPGRSGQEGGSGRAGPAGVTQWGSGFEYVSDGVVHLGGALTVAGAWVRRVDLVLARSAGVSGFLAAVD
jgi:hypothetical protein